jgi:hypothetical protein
VVIRGHSWSLVVTRGHSRSLVVIRGHSWSLVVIRGHSCVLLDKICLLSRLRLGLHLYRIAFRIAGREKAPIQYGMYNLTIFRSWAKHLSIAIIPPKIAFLKVTDRCFMSLRKAIRYSVNVTRLKLSQQLGTSGVKTSWYRPTYIL